jgi:hypothetical protein
VLLAQRGVTDQWIPRESVLASELHAADTIYYCSACYDCVLVPGVRAAHCYHRVHEHLCSACAASRRMVCVVLRDVEFADAMLTVAVCYHDYDYAGSTLMIRTRYSGLLVCSCSCSFVHAVFYDPHGQHVGILSWALS